MLPVSVTVLPLYCHTYDDGAFHGVEEEVVADPVRRMVMVFISAGGTDDPILLEWLTTQKS